MSHVHWRVTPEKIYPHQIPRTCEYDLVLEKDLCRQNEVKNIEMRSSWIIHVGPTSNGKCPYKKEAENLRHKEAEITVAWPQDHMSENAISSQKLEKARKDRPPPQASRGTMAS